jgi:alpha-N-acetylglucosaminidase
VQWTARYVRRRYGAADAHALAAWNILLDTAYDIHVDQVPFNSERDAAQESLFNAQPGLTANRASNWSPEAMRYKPEVFAHALTEMLQVAPALRDSETYRYDLVDIARQTLANESRTLLPQIRSAFEAKDRVRFTALTKRWLQLMELQDELLSSNRSFLVGSWLAQVPAWAATPDEAARLNYDARSLLTTWGDRKASEGADLHDYGNKDWAGLTRDYYLKRWQLYFASLDTQLKTGSPAKPIDWFALGDAWNHGNQHYATQEQGDTYALAWRVGKVLGLLPDQERGTGF